MLGLWAWPQAESELKRAIELNPSYSTEHRVYAALLVTLKRHDEAWGQINQAMRLDPLSLPNNAEVVRTLYYARDYDRAVEHGQKALQLNPDYYRTHFWLARAYAQKGLYEAAGNAGQQCRLDRACVQPCGKWSPARSPKDSQASEGEIEARFRPRLQLSCHSRGPQRERHGPVLSAKGLSGTGLGGDGSRG